MEIISYHAGCGKDVFDSGYLAFAQADDANHINAGETQSYPYVSIPILTQNWSVPPGTYRWFVWLDSSTKHFDPNNCNNWAAGSETVTINP